MHASEVAEKIGPYVLFGNLTWDYPAIPECFNS